MPFSKTLQRARREQPASARGATRFTMLREDLLQAEDGALRLYYADWLSAMTGMDVAGRTFVEDLEDGRVLCSLASRIEGSGVTKFHDVPKKPAVLRKFLQRDNLVKFQDACRRLGIPVLPAAVLSSKTVSTLVSALIYIEELCVEDGIEVVRPMNGMSLLFEGGEEAEEADDDEADKADGVDETEADDADADGDADDKKDDEDDGEAEDEEEDEEDSDADFVPRRKPARSTVSANT
eukprot:CAMPEP_0202083172 /NCGR_PEP_ID=MMETSP0964-20121228/22574_1 /ASSEMBLY_ACC=CAM_ASM_000500 /TAXON_ID=4773 /ORGANISM="Schizochytrium aggregatum, Strain ATCC28209" /LENGTH=236 /DNA_ID=CAMNT_0048650861 /DNA_START=56 /DNA_END=766 /DNA_ORIENTATION=-